MVRNSGPVPEDARGAAAAALLAQFTPRQRLVSIWLTAGFSDEEIASHLGITRQQLDEEFAELTRTLRRLNALGS